MADLVAIVYPSVEKAEEMRVRLIGLQKEYLLELGDAVVAEKAADGHVKLHQMMNMTAAGAASGGFWGLLVGMIFMMPLAGVALGAASGALGGALSDFGIEDKFMKGVAENVQPGNAVLFLLIKKMTTDRVLEAIRGAGGTVLRTSLDHTRETELRNALSGVVAAANPANPA
ncbi:MAG: DUF1269 domain-containing protein [Rhodoblastus sp.]